MSPAPGREREITALALAEGHISSFWSCIADLAVLLTWCLTLERQVEIPELDLEVSTGTMGGLISTVEGLVDTISQALKGTQVSFHARPLPSSQ